MNEHVGTVDPVEEGMDFGELEGLAREADKAFPEEGNPYTFLIKEVEEKESTDKEGVTRAYFQIKLSSTASSNPTLVGRTGIIFLDKDIRSVPKKAQAFAAKTLRDFVNLLKEQTGIHIYTGKTPNPGLVEGKSIQAEVFYSGKERPRLNLRAVRY